MKQLLLLFFLLLTPWLKAQYDVTSNDLVPFKDYRSCLTGLKNKYGNVVVKAEYDVVEPLYSLIDYQNHITGWVVKKAAGCGILSPEGEVQIPAIYETMVRWTSDTLIVGLNGKKGMINRKNEWLIPAKYDQLYSYSRSCLFYVVEGKTGIITKEFKELTPAVYDEIELGASYSMRDGYIPPPNIFKCKTGDKTGIIDLRKGELIPPVYDYITVAWVEEYCPDTEANYIVFKDSLQGVIRANGTWGVSLLKGNISIGSYGIDYCDNQSVQMALIRKSDGLDYVCNLQTRKMSAGYESIQPFQNRAIARNGERLILLDTNFTELFSSEKYYLSATDPDRSDEDYLMYKRAGYQGFGYRSPVEPRQQQVNWNDDVVYAAKILEEKNEEQLLISKKHGLLNYVTGKMIPLKYDAVCLREMDGKTWYWAYEYSEDSEEENYTVTIYDASMKRVDSYKIGKAFHAENQYRITKKKGPDIFLDQNGKYGAIDAGGKEVIPFEYSKCYFVLRKVWHHKEQDWFFAFGNEEKAGIYTNSGKLIVPVQYDLVRLLSMGIFELGNGNSIDLTTIDGTPISTNCTHARIAPVLSVNGELNSIQQAYSVTDTSQQSAYFVKDNYLYYYADRVTKKCNASFFEFTSDTLLVSYTYEIDKTGLVRNVYDPVELRRNRAEATKKSNYREVILYRDADPSFYWYSLADKAKGSTWHVLDSLKHPLFTYDFDYPTLGNSGNGHIFRVNGKYGVLSARYEVILPPEYDYICFNWWDCLVRKGNKWQLFSRKTKQFSEPFDQISTELYTNGRFVFQGDQIGFIDTNFQLILPFQSVENLVQENDLVAFCGKDLNGFERGQLLNLSMCKEDARILNNQLIVDKNRKEATDNQMLEIEERPYFWEKGTAMPLMHFTFNEESFSIARTIQRSDQKLLSFYTNEYVVYSYDDNRSVLLKRVCSNFRIVNRQLVPVKLNDLLKQDEASKEKFRELFLKELNATQFAGLDCPDVEVLLQGAQNQFSFTEHGLYIYLYKYTKITELSFSYRQLKEILLKPGEFGL